jgi:hypothetical protein
MGLYIRSELFSVVFICRTALLWLNIDLRRRPHLSFDQRIYLPKGTSPMRNYLQLVGKTDEELAATDPVVMNLLVARSIPGLEKLNFRAT